MADRKPLKEKSRPFTTFNHNFKFSISGNAEFQKIWTNFFKKNKINKSDFFNEKIKEMIGDEVYEDFLVSDVFKNFEKDFWKEILKLLNDKGFPFPNKQECIKYIVGAEEEKLNGKNKK